MSAPLLLACNKVRFSLSGTPEKRASFQVWDSKIHVNIKLQNFLEAWAPFKNLLNANL